MYFQIFLRKLGEQKPAVAFKFLNSVDLGPFLGAILSGLMESSAKEEARERLTSNSKRIETQLATAQVLLTKKDYDDSLFKELYPNLISTSDSQILTTLLQTIVLTYDKHRNHKGEFTEIIDKFTNLKFFSWSYVYFSGSKYYWQELTRDNIEAILRNLSNCENIGYEEESVLSVIGEKNPKEIVRFFEDRINLAVAKKLKTPIPFEFLVLNKTLAKFPEIVLPEVTAWLSDEDPLKKWLAGKLIENIFPSFGNSIEQFVLSLTRKKDAKSLDAVLRILEHYEGEPFVHNIVKEILLLHPIDEALRERLYHILSSTKGIIRGKYGFFDAYKLKKQQLIDWLNDSNTLIKEFTRGFIDYLDQLMDHEKNKVDKEVAFRKREFEMGQSK